MMSDGRKRFAALLAPAVLFACARTEKTSEAFDSTRAAASVSSPAVRTPYPFPRVNEAGANITVDVLVDNGAIIVDPANPPAARTLLATFTNNGPGKERKYKFEPKADFTYKLYAEPTKDPTTGTTAWTFDKVTPGGQQTPTQMKGGFHDCKDGPHNTKANAGFKKCGVLPWWPDSSKTASSTVMKSSMLSNPFFARLYAAVLTVFQDANAKKPIFDTDDPAWVACTGGCCTLAQ